MGGNMKSYLVFLMLFFPSVAFCATWSVKPSDMSRQPGLSEVVNIEKASISAKILAAYKASPAAGETYTDSGCTYVQEIVGTCTIVAHMTLADGSISDRSIRIGIVPGSSVSCPATVELKGKTAPIIQSGEKAYVSWSVSQVTPDNLCHNSCIYYASSATASTCYRTSAGASDGFCNFVVAVNSSAGSCTVSSGYAAASAGAELNPDTTPDPGGGGGGDDGGTDPNPGGGTGGGGSGGPTVVSGTVGVEFKSPGTLSSQLGHYLDQDGSVETATTQLPKDLSNQYQESDIGKKVDETVHSFSDLANVPHLCPTGQFELFDRVIILDAHCVLFAQIEPVLKLATYAAWMLVAVIIIFSA